MKFNDLRVAYKLWGVILGLLLLMFTVAFWTQVRTRQAVDEAEQLIQKYEDSITNAATWRGLAELAVTMSMASLVTTDEVPQKDFDARVAALTARITPVQERITKGASTPADKEALAYVASTRVKVRGVGDKVAELKTSGHPAARQEFHDKEFKPLVAQYLDAWRVGRHQNHGLLRMPRGLRVGLAHDNENGAARVAHARGPPFAAVDHIVVAVAFN